MTCVTGDETGLIKIWDISKSSGATLKYSFGDQQRERSIMGMCWLDSDTSSVAFSSKDGTLSLFDIKSKIITDTKKINFCSAVSSSLAAVKGKVVVVSKEGQFGIYDNQLNEKAQFTISSPIDSTHIHRKYEMVAVGGENNDLMVYNLAAQDVSTPVFKARNVQDHVLDVPYPVYIVGTCVINPFVFGTTTAYHQVRFYDSRASERPVQEFEISREIERRPTCMLQWNSNKFLIGEASGDVHLYDTRRGFTSRAKLRGGVGSVKSMCKHPAGHQLLSVTGLDRKVRLYHVPTGKLLQTFFCEATSQLRFVGQGHAVTRRCFIIQRDHEHKTT
ncbi:ribosome biogenesis protein NSA1 [Angomonas deanei]|nr:ribosome biogenesis protein NSA1 [Angomonas deanei]|eukprot:EPY24505.1 ribosome biogenesis protein NSA1 [Angomonas deanei]